MAKSNKLMVISGAIFTVFAIFYVFFFYYALAYIATQPATIAMLHYFLYWMWLYLIFAIAILIIGIIASKRENGWAIGGVSIGVTGAATIYHFYFSFRVALPYMPSVPTTMSMVIYLTLLIYSILVGLAITGGIIKIATAGSGGA